MRYETGRYVGYGNGFRGGNGHEHSFGLSGMGDGYLHFHGAGYNHGQGNLNRFVDAPIRPAPAWRVIYDSDA